MQKITTFLWFDDKAEEAAKFYVSIFPNSKIVGVARYTDVGPGPAGSVMTVDFELDGQPFVALNGGPQFPFTEAISLVVNCETQEEIDRTWDALSAGGKIRAVRLAQGPIRAVVAGRADAAGDGDAADQRSGAPEPRDEGGAGIGEAGHREVEGRVRVAETGGSAIRCRPAGTVLPATARTAASCAATARSASTAGRRRGPATGAARPKGRSAPFRGAARRATPLR